MPKSPGANFTGNDFASMVNNLQNKNEPASQVVQAQPNTFGVHPALAASIAPTMMGNMGRPPMQNMGAKVVSAVMPQRTMFGGSNPVSNALKGTNVNPAVSNTVRAKLKPTQSSNQRVNPLQVSNPFVTGNRNTGIMSPANIRGGFMRA